MCSHFLVGFTNVEFDQTFRVTCDVDCHFACFVIFCLKVNRNITLPIPTASARSQWCHFIVIGIQFDDVWQRNTQFASNVFYFVIVFIRLIECFDATVEFFVERLISRCQCTCRAFRITFILACFDSRFNSFCWQIDSSFISQFTFFGRCYIF